MFDVVLVNPEIPPNTGNIGRLTLGTGTNLHIVGDPSFDLANDRMLKRAGLDYWDDVTLEHNADWNEYKEQSEPDYYLVSKFAERPYYRADFSPGDSLIFGGETEGVPKTIADDPDVQPICLPMNDNVRSYNICNTVAVVLFEALRQTDRSPDRTPYSSLEHSCTSEYQASSDHSTS